MFKGWPDEALEFFEALEAENTRTYWQAHKATYQRAVLGPLQALLADLAPAWGEGSVMRPNRDIRFSADKSPYKTFIAARIGPGYVQLNARGFGAGCGVWEVAPDQLERYRQAVADDGAGAALSSIVDTLAEAGIDIAAHQVLKTAPRGYPKDHPRIELLRRKGIAAWHDWPAGPWLGTPEPLARVSEFLQAAAPLNAWLERHVGPSTLPPRR